ncbi:uracil-DNA glycosylase [Proteiniclasticum ruminis]|uniref:Uracil-DNA glycosylase n=1 Tax=Proteiniclasticum ruminis TaxID=398199 RepID=A0A1G8HG05_9CLOT|nr:uracil-DNA glycosylase [Proteiniclasticum ruminis]SDI05573.1 uracil-DNA glycosylase [Proteiniclasticum ruminis]
MEIRIGNSWDELLQEEVQKPYFQKLLQFLEKEYTEKTVFPKKEEIFRAFQMTPVEKVKVVILGQDPYHGENQAEGLAFSVRKGEKIPPSLRNIYKELESDLAIKSPDHGSLLSWAEEGVLLLNTVLTVEKGKANSHQKKGWEVFTDHVIKKMGAQERPVVFFLWGNAAISKKKLIEKHHKIIESVHPSPLSARRGFFGSKPFSEANEFLMKTGQSSVKWQNL